jgi:uncharacterized membrane protein YtjA (UPF0391 family)
MEASYEGNLQTYFKTLVDRIENLNDRVWTHASFFSGTVSALLIATVTLSFEHLENNSILLPLPILGFAMSTLGYLSLRRQFRTLYTYISVLSKLEAEMGLTGSRTQSFPFPDDKRILHEGWESVRHSVGPYWRKSQDFIEYNMWRLNLHGAFLLLFASISLVSLFIALFLFASSWESVVGSWAGIALILFVIGLVLMLCAMGARLRSRLISGKPPPNDVAKPPC